MNVQTTVLLFAKSKYLTNLYKDFSKFCISIQEALVKK